jgi:hypothetical protein
MNKPVMSGGLLDFEAILAHAQSDARFDGRDWETLSAPAQQRYLERVQAGYEAAARATLADQIRHETKN